MATRWTADNLTHLEGLTPAEIHAELDATLFWLPCAAPAYPFHEEFCDFREHLLSNPRSLRARYPKVGAAVRTWVRLPHTKDLFMASLRMHPCNMTLRNMLAPAGPQLAVPVLARPWAVPGGLVAGARDATTASPNVPDMLSDAVSYGCHACIQALDDIMVLPLDPATISYMSYTECGVSLLMIAQLAFVGHNISEDECNNVIDILRRTNGLGSQLWNRAWYTHFGLPTAGPLVPPLSALNILQDAVMSLPSKSIEMLSEWHEDGSVIAPDPLMAGYMGPSLLYECCKRASIRIAEWLKRHATALGHGYVVHFAVGRMALGKGPWHAIVRNPAGIQLFDWFVSQGAPGAPFAADAPPWVRSNMTDESPMFDAISLDRPVLVEKFANYHPPIVWLNYPLRPSEFLWALVKTSVESATSLYHVVGVQEFQTHCIGARGSFELAITRLAHYYVLGWYEWNYHFQRDLARLGFITRADARALYADLRRVTSLKMTAVLHYMPRTWFGTAGEKFVKARCAIVGAYFLLRHIRPETRFHVTRWSGRSQDIVE